MAPDQGSRAVISTPYRFRVTVTTDHATDVVLLKIPVNITSTGNARILNAYITVNNRLVDIDRVSFLPVRGQPGLRIFAVTAVTPLQPVAVFDVNLDVDGPGTLLLTLRTGTGLLPSGETQIVVLTPTLPTITVQVSPGDCQPLPPTGLLKQRMGRQWEGRGRLTYASPLLLSCCWSLVIMIDCPRVKRELV